MSRGVILYGPPAAGKDTVTTALQELNPEYVQFQRLKAGPGRTEGYRMTTPDHVDELQARGQVIWQNHRYGATYVVDRAGLLADLASGVPVVHLGQVEAVEAIRAALPGATWLTVYLWCPREVAAERARQRGTGDVADRLRAWDETAPLTDVDLTIDTAQVAPDEAARQVDQALTRHASHVGR